MHGSCHAECETGKSNQNVSFNPNAQIFECKLKKKILACEFKEGKVKMHQQDDMEISYDVEILILFDNGFLVFEQNYACKKVCTPLI